MSDSLPTPPAERAEAWQDWLATSVVWAFRALAVWIVMALMTACVVELAPLA